MSLVRITARIGSTLRVMLAAAALQALGLSAARAQPLDPSGAGKADEKTAQRQVQEARDLNRKVIQLHQQGKYAEATEAARRALAIRERLYPGDHPDLAQSLNNLGVLLDVRGRLDEAQPYYERALAMRQRLYPEGLYPDGHPDLAHTLDSLAALLRRRGRLDEALPYLERALAMRQRLYPKGRYPDGHPELAFSLNSLGLLLQVRGQLEQALRYHERALAMRQRLYPQERYPQGHPHLATSLNNLGLVLQAQRRRDEALPYLERALAMNERLYPKGRYPDGHPQLAITLGNLGNLLREWGRLDEALPPLRRALAMYERLYPPERYPAGHPDLASSLNNLGLVLQGQGRLEEALPYLKRALAMLERLYHKERYPAGHAYLASSLNNVGVLLWAHRQPDEALPYLERALAMLERLYHKERYPQGHPELARSLINLGTALRERGRRDEALPYLERALAMQQSLLDDFAQRSSEAAALDLAGGLPVFRDAYLSATADLPGAAGRSYRLVWPTRAALARALERRRLALGAASAEARRAAADLLALRRQLEVTLAAPVGDAAARDGELRRLMRRKEELERALAAALPGLARLRAQDQLGPGDLAAGLPAHAAFVDLLRYVRLEYDPKEPGRAGERRTPRYVAFVLAPGREVSRVELGPALPIEAALAHWRLDLVKGIEGRAAQELRRLLWQPLAAQLSAGTQALYLAADGALARLPWAALPLSQAGTPLLQRYRLALVPHGTFLLQRLRQPVQPTDHAGTLLAVGGVHYDREGPGKNFLPGTALELTSVRAVAGTRPCVPLSSAEASADRLLAELPKARFVHLATHGFFKEKEFLQEERRRERLWQEWKFQTGTITERVGLGARNPLALAGLLLAGANQPRGADTGLVSGETLAALSLEDLELAVLSACETGLDLGASGLTGEGGQTLARALHVAGARNVVASLWQVPDVPTLVLMEQFYGRLWDTKQPLGPAEALRQAQLALWRNPGLVEKRLQELRAELVKRGLGEAELEARGFGRELQALPGGGRVDGLRRSPALWWAGFALSGDGR
jgi:CHAT domain-containing protein/Tfp pilus assembly protein PilF